MSYLALYRKYRPIDFDDVYGQKEVVTVIKNAINCNKVSHAYLFCGPRGTGKTTIAKIIARLVNCEHLDNGKPCGKCYSCLNFLNSSDIVEIDAASNNGVDEIRELRDKVNLVPSNSKYKVYIIDEVHMLTNQAFNALLKTLEEPPAHVIFILATTEPHKIPLTIASRCQKFRFSKISDDQIVDRLKEISEIENIIIEDDALFEIARLADGGMRDAINMLDQLIAYSNSNITLNDIYKVNGSVSYDDLSELLKSIITSDKIKVIEFIDRFDEDGKEINKFVEELIIFLKDVILYKNTNLLSTIESKNTNIKKISELYDSKVLYNLIETLNNVQNMIRMSTNGSILFMTSLLKFSDTYFNKIEITDNINNSNSINNNLETNVCDKDKNISREIIKTKNIDNLKESNFSNEEINVRINNALALASKEVLENIKNNWNLIDEYIYDDQFSIVSGLLKDSSVVVGSEKYVIIASELTSIVDRINENTKIIESLFKKMFGYKLFVVGITIEKWNIEKKNYINNVRSGIKYTIKEHKISNVFHNEKTPVDELIDLVGDNIIEYK